MGEAEGLTREVVALASRPGEGLWVTVEEKGLFYYCDGRCEPVAGPPGLELFHGYGLVLDYAGSLWVSIGNGMVLRLDAGKWTIFKETHGLPYSYIYCLTEGVPGEIWAGSRDAGLYVFREGRFHAVPTSEAAIRAVGMGRDGVVWVGLETEGLCRLTPRLLTTVPVGSGKRSGPVNGLLEDPVGELWVASFGGGLHHGPLASLEAAPDIQALEERPFLTAALKMSDGTLYFGGVSLLLRREPRTGELQPISLSGNYTALCEAADGSLLLGMREGELLRLVDDEPQPVANWKPLAPIAALVRGPESSVWVATKGAGLFRWDAGVLQRWTTAEGLPTDVLRALYQDAGGTLWIGTDGGGLVWLEGGRLHAIDSRKGLGDNVISQILEDDQENLWLGCHRGIFRVSKRELRAVAAGEIPAVHPLALDEADGMLVVDCTGGYSPAGLRSASGVLYFSTVRGVVAVDPKAFRSSAVTPPEVLIEDVLLDGNPLSRSTGPLTLPPGPRELEIHYTAFNYFKPAQIRFRHRLQGGRREGGKWTDAGHERAVRLSLLPPGDYTLQVSAANADGRWTEPGASLAFSVAPFFWQTAWFRAGVTLLVMAIGGAFAWHWTRARYQRALERERLARAEAEARQHLNELTHVTRVATLAALATTLAHELNQPLAAIHSNAEAAEIFLQKDAPDLAELRAIFTDIRDDGDRARTVIQRMRAMLQRHPFEAERVEVRQTVEALDKLIHGVFTARGARLQIEIAPTLPPVQADAVHLQQLLLNLVLNSLDAMSDCPEAERTVFFRATAHDPRWVEVSVTDRGPGFPAEKLAKLSEPFFTTKKDGMGLGLAICHSIVEAHGGQLTAENLHGRGASVRFTLPASQPPA
ncbi:MAG: ATP-binding protein [Chthoniobacteraceae bacterium]